MGFSQGAPFALACASAGIVTAAAIVSGTDELAHPVFSQALAPDVRKLVEAVAADPVAAEASFAGFGNAEVMWQMVSAMSSPVDRAVYTEPSFERAFRRALAEGFARGPARYARDTVLANARWPFAPAAIAVPVDLWYGGQDTSPVHSPDFGETLGRRIPGANRHFLPAKGGALLWTHAGAILGALLGHVGRC